MSGTIAPGCVRGSSRGNALVACICQRGIFMRSYSPSTLGPNLVRCVSTGRHVWCMQRASETAPARLVAASAAAVPRRALCALCAARLLRAAAGPRIAAIAARATTAARTVSAAAAPAAPPAAPPTAPVTSFAAADAVDAASAAAASASFVTLTASSAAAAARRLAFTALACAALASACDAGGAEGAEGAAGAEDEEAEGAASAKGAESVDQRLYGELRRHRRLFAARGAREPPTRPNAVAQVAPPRAARRATEQPRHGREPRQPSPAP